MDYHARCAREFQCAWTMNHAEQTFSHLAQSDASTATSDINLSVHLERMLSTTYTPLT